MAFVDSKVICCSHKPIIAKVNLISNTASTYSETVKPEDISAMKRQWNGIPARTVTVTTTVEKLVTFHIISYSVGVIAMALQPRQDFRLSGFMAQKI